MAHNKEKTKALIARSLMDIVHSKIKCKKAGLVFVNEVKVNDDYSLAKIYVSFPNNKYPNQALEELKKKEGETRFELAKVLPLYKTPIVRYIYDSSFDNAERIEYLLSKDN